MEGPIPPRSKPLSYDALKSVIKSMSVEKRQEIHNNLPSLRVVNSVLPNTINEVWITPNELIINRKRWTFHENSDILYPDNNDPYQGLSSPDITINKSLNEAFEKCFNFYLKNGSNINRLDIDHVPKFLCERDGSDGFKLNILRLGTHSEIVDKFDSFIRFVNLDKLEHIHIDFHENYNEHEEDFGILERPEIINCKNLDLYVSVDEIPPINYTSGLRNQNLVLYDSNFQVNELRMLIENWKISDRPIGTSFCLWSYENNTKDMFDSLNQQNTFPVEIERNSTIYRGIRIKMDEDRDLVLYQGEHLLKEESPAVKIEVIASGSLKKIVDSEPIGELATLSLDP